MSMQVFDRPLLAGPTRFLGPDGDGDQIGRISTRRRALDPALALDDGVARRIVGLLPIHHQAHRKNAAASLNRAARRKAGGCRAVRLPSWREIVRSLSAPSGTAAVILAATGLGDASAQTLPNFANVCSGVQLPTLTLLNTTTTNTLNTLVPAPSPGLGSFLNGNFTALSGTNLAGGLLNTSGNLLQGPCAGAAAPALAVTTEQGISLGGGRSTGLGGTQGTVAVATEVTAIAVGNGAITSAGAQNALAVGTTARAFTTGAIALGPNSTAGLVGGLANDIALGAGASSMLGNSIALGAESRALRGAEAGYTGYGGGTVSSAGELAVGTAAAARVVTGVSAGRLGTDAVNVSQLSAVGSQLVGIVGAGAGFDATGILAGPLFNTALGTTATTVQQALANETAAITALGSGTATALGGGKAYDPLGGGLSGGFNVNGTNYTDVATAISGTAAAATTAATAAATAASGLQRTAALNDIALTAPGGTGTTPGVAQTLSNVAAGAITAASTQAVNGGQLLATAQSVAARLGGGAGVDANGTISAPSFRIGQRDYADVGAALAAGNALSLQYTPNALNAPTNAIDLTKAATLGTVSITGLANATTATGAVALGQLAVRYADAAGAATPATPSNTVALVGASAALPVTLGNVAAGAVNAASTQAINGGQLLATAQSVSTALGGNTVVDANGRLTAPSFSVAGTPYATVGQALSALGDGIASGALSGLAAENIAGRAAPVASGAGALAAGFGASATGAGSTAIGGGAIDNGVANSTTLGSGASIAAGLTGSNVALGQGSAVTAVATAVPNAVINGTTYAFAGGAPAGVVSIGAAGLERQIQNVAAGRLTAGSTDAVNGSQLFATNQAVAGIASGTLGLVQQDSTTRAITVGAGIDGTTLALANSAGTARTLTGVAGGAVAAGSTQAINGGQLFGSAQSVAAGLGGGASVNADGTVSLPTYTVAGNTYGNVGDALAAGNKASVQYATNAAGNALSNIDLTRGGTLAPVAMTGLANATTASGAVTLGQLPVQYTNAAGILAPATPSNTVGLVGANAGAPVTLGNVAAGTVSAASTQAVNGAQLRGTALSVSTALGGGSVVNADGSVSAPIYNVVGGTYTTVGSALSALDAGINAGRLGAFVADNTAGLAAPAASGANALAGGFGTVAAGARSTAIGNAAVDNGVANSTVLGSGASIAAGLSGSNVALGQGSVASVGARANYGAFGLTTPQNAAGTVSVGAVGAERTLSNVAAGTAGTDAVNVAQLSGSAARLGGSLAAGLGGGAAYDPATGEITAPTITVGGRAYTSVGSALAAGNALSVQYTPDANGNATNAIDLTKGGALAPIRVTGVAPGSLTATSTDAVNGSQLYATNQTVAGLVAGRGGPFASDNTSGQAGPVASGTDASAGGFGARALSARSTALGAGATASGTNSVALGAGSTDGGAANVISVGAVGGERRITNLAAGVNLTDAANTGQVTALAARSLQYDTTATGATNYQSITLNPTGSGPVTIHNLAPGVALTDAATVGQLGALAGNAVQYATNSNGTRSNTLALVGGNAAAPVTISNVAAGVAPTDAVNVAQLQGALNGGFNNLAQIGEYQFRTAKQAAYAGTSIALATAGIRYDDRPGKISLGLGASGYHGSAGLAVGIGGTSEDGKWRINVSAGFSPNNDKASAGFLGGATYTFN